ncbi:sensor histidine kinase [Actinophytocola oryzae]|uniref:sensor histidine kinase n=1 Tax=Actinophytocola oryzae TaxID=502181 RepID=UPI00141516AF|nr:histidine kinase [Actinophytocola oryzae]
MTIRRLGLWVTVAALLVLGFLDLVQHYATHTDMAIVLAYLRVVPLVIYRWPVAAWVIELVAVFMTASITIPVSSSEPWPWAVSSIGSLAATAGLVATLGRRTLSSVMFGIQLVVSLLLMSNEHSDWQSAAVATAACGLAIIIGDFVHGRRAMVVELAEERQVSAAERELRSVVEERARIARELHDVVAHHMSMITVQAESARFRHQDLPEPVATEFTEIAKVARASLSELRGLLSALRDESEDPNRTPQPTLADLPALVDRITTAGTPVTLRVETDTEDLPQVTQLAVYRIVQEGLSNVVRHAGNAKTTVDITRANDTLHIEVTNERPPVPPKPAPRGGHGLVGLRERATLLGGKFEVDQPAEGWRVRAELPL